MDDLVKFIFIGLIGYAILYALYYILVVAFLVGVVIYGGTYVAIPLIILVSLYDFGRKNRFPNAAIVVLTLPVLFLYYRVAHYAILKYLHSEVPGLIIQPGDDRSRVENMLSMRKTGYKDKKGQEWFIGHHDYGEFHVRFSDSGETLEIYVVPRKNLLGIDPPYTWSKLAKELGYDRYDTGTQCWRLHRNKLCVTLGQNDQLRAVTASRNESFGIWNY